MADPKNIAAMLASSIDKGGMASPTGGGDSDAGGETDSDPAEESAAEEIMTAITGNDPQGFATALKSFIEICMNKSDAGPSKPY